MLNKEIIIRRLALIKYLYQRGIEQSRQAEVVAGFSILSFHDSIEMFLLLAAEHRNMKTDKLSFMDFWEKIPDLTLGESMKALKDRRVSIKHKSQFPSKGDIDISRINVTDFFEQNTKIQFEIDFENVSLLDLINYDDVKIDLKKAQKFLEEKKFEKSLLNTKIAFDKLIYSYESNKKHVWYKNIFEIGTKINKRYYLFDTSKDRAKTEWFEGLTETTNKIREVVKLTSLGIDFKRYSVFQFITPKIYRTMTGEYEFTPSFTGKVNDQNIKMNKENCLFCIDFVIDCAIKLQEFDFDLKEYIHLD